MTDVISFDKQNSSSFGSGKRTKPLPNIDDLYDALANDNPQYFTNNENNDKSITFPYFNKTLETSLLSLSAFFGSIKCFQYFLLNTPKSLLNSSTLPFALAGGNSEIIKLIDQQMNQPVKEHSLIALLFRHDKLFDWYTNGLIPKTSTVLDTKTISIRALYAFSKTYDRYDAQTFISLCFQDHYEKAALTLFTGNPHVEIVYFMTEDETILDKLIPYMDLKHAFLLLYNQDFTIILNTSLSNQVSL